MVSEKYNVYTALLHNLSYLAVSILGLNNTYRRRHTCFRSTGLKQYGKDEWHQEKHGVNPRRTWRKLHVAVDENNMLHAISLTDKSIHDAEVVPELLEQIDESADRYVDDGAYDTKEVYDAIAKHNKRAKIVIPPRENAVASESWHSERNKSLDIIKERCRGAWSKMENMECKTVQKLSRCDIKRLSEIECILKNYQDRKMKQLLQLQF